jgi:ApaG protein
MTLYAATTEEVTVSVRPLYLDDQSDAFVPRFVFAYFVRIENEGPEEVQLLRRHWLIHHGDGRTTEVEGEGVVGEQPVIAPRRGPTSTTRSACWRRWRVRWRGPTSCSVQNGARLRVSIPRFYLRARAN